MDADALFRPVGPRPPRVYWTRRAVLLVALAAIVVIVARACSGGSATPAQGPASPSPTATTSTTPSVAPVAISSCQPAELAVTASTDATTYPAGALPRLSAVVRNASSHPCRFETSPAARVWSIVSGSDQVWSSSDCTISGVKSRSRLRPGHTIVYALVWDRHRSADGCPADTPAAGPGTYQLKVSINGAAAPVVVFHLTD